MRDRFQRTLESWAYEVPVGSDALLVVPDVVRVTLIDGPRRRKRVGSPVQFNGIWYVDQWVWFWVYDVEEMVSLGFHG